MRGYGLMGVAVVVGVVAGAPAPAALTDPAEFVIGTGAVRQEPARFGTNLYQRELNNFTGDPGFEPFTIRNWGTATGGDASHLENRGSGNRPGLDYYESLAHGVLDGARVRVYRRSGNSLALVRDSIATTHHAGWDQVYYYPTTASGYRDTAVTPGATYHYMVRAVNAGGQSSGDSAFVSAVAMAGSAVPDPLPPAPSFAPTTGGAPTAPTGLVATPEPGQIRLDWNDNPEGNIAGYYIYRSEIAPEAMYRLNFAAPGPVVEAGDIYVFELSQANPRVDRIHRRLHQYWPGGVPIDTWRVQGAGATAVRDEVERAPAAMNPGRSSYRIESSTTDTTSLRQFAYNHPGDYTRPAFEPGRAYRMEVLLRQSGIASGTVRFALRGVGDTAPGYDAVGHTFAGVDGTWRRYTVDFTGPALPNPGGLAEHLIEFDGPGTLWVDNFLIYDPAVEPLAPLAETHQALVDFQPGVIRLWTGQTNEDWGTTLEDWTNIEMLSHNSWSTNNGRVGPFNAWKLPTVLPLCEEVGAAPWLIGGAYLNEDEWRGLAEYLAAPYDPLVDSPATKPWAWKRYSQGRAEPWTDAFDTLHIEWNNEAWNPLFQFYVGDPTLTGTMSEHFFDAFRSSPYYPAVASKIRFVGNGWIGGTDINGYGQRVALTAPSVDTFDVATYLGGWEFGITLGGGAFTDSGLSSYITYSSTILRDQIDGIVRTRAELAAMGRVVDVSLYEGGPGYDLPSIFQVFNEVSEQYGKSHGAGTTTLDAYLYNSYVGVDPQAYFNFGSGANWASHTPPRLGYRAHPSWLALQMRNAIARGDMVRVQALGTPTTDIAPITAGSPPVPVTNAYPNHEMAAAYAFRDGQDYFVFVLSRRVDGDTPVTLRLPFDTATNVTVHEMTGDLRDNNRTASTVTLASSPAVLTGPTFAFALPPGEVRLLAFEGTNAPLPPAQPSALVHRAGSQSATTTQPVAVFEVQFSEPVAGFDAGDIVLGGTSGASAVAVEEAAPFDASTYRVIVTDLLQPGTIIVELPAARASALATSQPNTAATTIGAGNAVTWAPPPPADVVFVADDFDSGPQPNAPSIHEQDTGFGWAPVSVYNPELGFGELRTGWRILYADSFPTSYQHATTNPPTIPGFAATPGHAIGGAEGQNMGRAIDVAGALANYRVFNSDPPLVGLSGTTLWLSAVLRTDQVVNTPGAESSFALVGIDGLPSDLLEFYNPTGFGAVSKWAVGHFGPPSMVGGQRRWTLRVRNAANDGWDYATSARPVVAGESVLAVVRLDFGATDRLRLWIDPPLGAGDPGVASADWTTTGANNIVFRTLGFHAGPGAGYGALDEVRIGDSYRAVTPSPATHADVWYVTGP